MSNLCIVNVRTVVENYMFDEFDEIQGMDEQQQENISISDIDPSHYMKRRQSAGIFHANKTPNQETN